MCNHDWITCGDEKTCWLCGQVAKADEPGPSVTEMIWRQKNRPINQVLHGNSLEVLKTQESVICGKENVQGIDKFINQIIHGDCLEVMKEIPNNSIDMILCDLPYGTTACKWDTVIPFEPLWEQYERIIKVNGAIVLFGSEPFSSNLRMSNIKNYKYDWVWDKRIPSGMSYARFQPMRRVENIMVFTKNGEKTVYNPQLELRDKPIKKGGNRYSPSAPIQASKEGKTFKKTYTHKQPTNLLQFDKVRQGSVHPTQKPVELCEYLIRTYTNEGETVLDNCIGSGTTAIACINTGRNYIGIELDEQYVEIARRRINAVGEQSH